MRCPVLLALVLVLVLLAGQHPAEASLLYMNISRYLTQLRSVPALFENLQFSVPMAALVVLSTVAAGQYGYLPLRTSQVVRKVEELSSRWRARSQQPHGNRYPRAATQHPDSIDVLITAIQLLEEGLRSYGGHKSARRY